MLLYHCLYRVYARIAWLWTRFQFLKRSVLSLFFSQSSYIQFFWNSAIQYEDPFLRHVPSGTFHVEQWEREGDLRRFILHEYDEVVPYEGDPFRGVKKPWLWIGNEHDDSMDISQTLDPYMVPGNRITPEFLNLALHLDDVSYMDPRSFAVVKFPDEGIVLEADDTL